MCVERGYGDAVEEFGCEGERVESLGVLLVLGGGEEGNYMRDEFFGEGGEGGGH